MVLMYIIIIIDLGCLTIGCKQVSFVWQLQLIEGSAGWSTMYPHLQTQEDMEGGVLKEKKVSTTPLLSLSMHTPK